MGEHAHLLLNFLTTVLFYIFSVVDRKNHSCPIQRDKQTQDTSTTFVNYESYCLCRTPSPVAIIFCPLFGMFLVAVTIVVSLIPTYLPSRNLGNVNTQLCMFCFLSFIFFAQNFFAFHFSSVQYHVWNQSDQCYFTDNHRFCCIVHKCMLFYVPLVHLLLFRFFAVHGRIEPRRNHHLLCSISSIVVNEYWQKQNSNRVCTESILLIVVIFSSQHNKY